MPEVTQPVVLGAGTKFKMKIGEDYTLIDDIEAIGDTGSEAPAVERAGLDQLSKRYISGMIDGDDKDIVFDYNKESTNQQAFRVAAKNREVRDFEIEFPNGVTARFEMALLGFRVNSPEKENILKATVKGKMSGDVEWGSVNGQSQGD
ncbi:MAG: hypothetical protein JJU10_05460 [Idiomarina sp.]|nr:hypothetical protein [Idiomarina sp.]